MDPSPASMSSRRKNHLGGTRIGAPEQLQVSDDEQNNDEDQLVDNVRDDSRSEADDHTYEILTRNREQRGTFSLNFKERSQKFQ